MPHDAMLRTEPPRGALQHIDPYVNSVAVERVLETEKIIALDLDGSGDGTIEQRQEVDAIARRQGCVLYASARAEEQMMSLDEYERSVEQFGFDRPRSHKLIENVYQYQLDPHVMCPFGGVPQLLQKEGGFARDVDVVELLDMRDWSTHVRAELSRLDVDFKIHAALAPIEDIKKFETKDADVVPLPFRIQLDWRGQRAQEEMNEVMRIINESPLRKKLWIYDESNPAKERYTRYLVPPKASKGTMVNHVIRRIATTADLFHHDLSVDVVGDTLTDMSMLSMLPNVEDFRFLLAGGSRITPHFNMDDPLFGEPYAGTPIAAICKRLQRTDRPGVYTYHLPSRVGEHRDRVHEFYLGDIVYPGLIGAESEKAFLEERN